MLQVAVERLAERFPGAVIQCITGDADRLRRFAPRAEPLSCEGVRQWALTPMLDQSRFPGVVYDPIYHRIEKARRRGHGLIRSLIGPILNTRGQDDAPMRAYLSAVEQADLVIGTGGGYLTDAFDHQARMVLGTLSLAQSMNKLTAMVGQGLGPLNNPVLRAYSAGVLKRLQLLGLREDVAGRPLLEEMGVDRVRVETTGDDAIEAIYRSRPDRPGDGIGVNLRVAGYAGPLAEKLGVFREMLGEMSKRLDAPLIPLPIALLEEDSDVVAIGRVMDGGDWPVPDMPQEVIERSGRCRVVMTGSYHAAIFALSQGVAVVGVVASEYYAGKMRGIAGQFPGGCVMVRADQPDLAGRLRQAIETQWDAAPALRDSLLESARRQIEKGRSAYDYLASLVAS